MPATAPGRHRARRMSPLRRPAVAATASLSALAVSAAGYANSTDTSAADSSADLQLGHSARQHAAGAADVAAAPAAQQVAARSAAHSSARAATAARLAADQAKSSKYQQQARAAVARALAGATLMRSSTVTARVAVPAAAEETTKTTERTESAPAKSTESSTETSTPARTSEASKVSRSTERPSVASTPTVSGSPRDIGRQLAAARGWGASQFSCLDKLWTKESNWRVTADNPSSSAYGIPQALPGRKMASIGADWATNPATQIKWGLGYIADRYGTPCSAWAHSVAVNWY